MYAKAVVHGLDNSFMGGWTKRGSTKGIKKKWLLENVSKFTDLHGFQDPLEHERENNSIQIAAVLEVKCFKAFTTL